MLRRAGGNDMTNKAGGRWRLGGSQMAEADTEQVAAPCEVGDRVEISGRLRTVSLQPCDSLCALIAELYNGTDAINLVWLGRRTITGIEAGRHLRVTGRVAMRDGHKTIYNPVYALLPMGTV